MLPPHSIPTLLCDHDRLSVPALPEMFYAVPQHPLWCGARAAVPGRLAWRGCSAAFEHHQG